MNINFYKLDLAEYVPYFKNGNKIHIKKANRGKFTEYCGGNVTDECILRGKNSSNPKIRKRATFAANARKWNKKDGGRLPMHNPGVFTEIGNMTNLDFVEKVKKKYVRKMG